MLGTVRALALSMYAALLVLIFAWEAWLAPAATTPRVFWLILKLTPLAFPLYGLISGNAKVYVFAALIVLLYFIEGVVLTFGGWKGIEGRGVLAYGMLETLLATGFFVVAAYYVRLKGLGSTAPARE